MLRQVYAPEITCERRSMKSGHDYLQRADRLIWTAIAITGGAVLASSFRGPFHIDWTSFQAIPEPVALHGGRILLDPTEGSASCVRVVFAQCKSPCSVARGSQGIITFPSLHSAGAFLFIFAMWPVKYLRWVAALLNVTMIAPIDGGHYFSDVIAGTAVAILCWMAAARILYASQTRPEPLATIQYPPSIVPDARSHPETAASSRKLESV